MIKSAYLEWILKGIEQGKFQRICNRILEKKGYTPYKYTGSVQGSDKTSKGTPDSVFNDAEGNYVYVEITTQENGLVKKIRSDVKKCLEKIEDNPILKDHILKILFLHNGPNIEETVTEEIRKECKEIQFSIYGYEYISNYLCNEGEDIAIAELDVPPTAVVSINNSRTDYVKEEISKLYKDAAIILNELDSLVYITKAEENRLQDIYDRLRAFNSYFDDNNPGSLNYYYNLLAIASALRSFTINDLSVCIPPNINSDSRIMYLKAILLHKSSRYEDAFDILKALYDEGNTYVIGLLVEVLFDMEKYQEVIKFVSMLSERELDRRGILAALYIKSSIKTGKYTADALKKVNIKKFANKPLYYAEIAVELKNGNVDAKSIRKQFDKALDRCDLNDVLTLAILSDKSIVIGYTERMKKLLRDKTQSNAMFYKYCQLLCRDSRIDFEDIQRVKAAALESLDDITMRDYLNAKINESQGLMHKAIQQYEINYRNNHDFNSGINYLMLSLRNNMRINKNIIDLIARENTDDADIYKICAQAYYEEKRIDESLNCLYKAIYLTKSTEQNKLAGSFWYYSSFKDSNEPVEVNMITSNSVVEIETNNSINYFIMEDDEFFNEKRYVLGARICRTSSSIGSLLIGSKCGDLVKLDGKKSLIKKIYDKYGYIAICGVKTFKTNEHIQVITTEDGDVNAGLQKIKKILIENNLQMQRRFEIYKKEKYVPISTLVGKERTFKDYFKTIGALLSDGKYPYYAGEPIDVDFEKGFVIDITSIIVMRVLGVMDNLPDNVVNKAVVTTSTKMKFKRFYEDLINSKKNTTEQLYIGKDNDIHLGEIKKDEEVLYWKPVNSFIERAQEIQYEGSYDTVIKNDAVLDKCQIDSIKYAKEQGLPYVCDDLSTRIMANLCQTNHTNSLMLEATYIDDYMKIMNTLERYAKSNYVYSIYPSLNKQIFKPLLDSFSKQEYQNEFSTFIGLCIKNAISKEYHAPVLEEIKKAIEPYRYFEILNDSVYENIFVSFVLETINKVLDNVF